MRAFPGQLTTHGAHGCQALVWTLAAFYLKMFFIITRRISAVFQVDDA